MSSYTSSNRDRDVQILNDYIEGINDGNNRLQYKDYLAEQMDALLTLLVNDQDNPTLSANEIEFYCLVLALRTYEFVHEDCNFPDVVDEEGFQLSNYPDKHEVTGRPLNRVCLQLIRPDMEYVVIEGPEKEDIADAIGEFLNELENYAKKYIDTNLEAEGQ
jgi:hypothetical protein